MSLTNIQKRNLLRRGLTEDRFRQVCEESLTATKACATLEMQYGTFRSYAIALGCFEPNKAGKGIKRNKLPTVPIQDVLSGRYAYSNAYLLKKRLIKEGIKEEKCECCGLSEWRNAPIAHQLHHKDGNRNNNRLDNLELLCPNCHSQTETFTGRNKGK